MNEITNYHLNIFLSSFSFPILEIENKDEEKIPSEVINTKQKNQSIGSGNSNDDISITESEEVEVKEINKKNFNFKEDSPKSPNNDLYEHSENSSER